MAAVLVLINASRSMRYRCTSRIRNRTLLGQGKGVLAWFGRAMPLHDV
jgi:hypothetical protein